VGLWSLAKTPPHTLLKNFWNEYNPVGRVF
jgi:hypothetical protein